MEQAGKKNFPTRRELSTVIPVFNESEIIEELVERLIAACQACTTEFEIIFVNDGSRDDTLFKLISFSNKYSQLRIINLSRNFGHMAALSAGLNNAHGKAVVIMDGDLQDPPELIPEMYAKWQADTDVVLAKRTKRNESLRQRIFTKLFYFIITRLTKQAIPSQVGTYCLLDYRCVEALKHLPEKQKFFAGMRSWIGFKQDFIYYDRPERLKGNSKVGFSGLLHLARVGIISFSDLPLRMVGLLSFLAGFVLSIFGLIVIGIKLVSQAAIPGWASTMVLVGFVSAIQSICIAVICEYLAIIFVEIKSRPDYFIKEEFINGISSNSKDG